MLKNSTLSIKDVSKLDNKDELVQLLKQVYRHGKEIFPKQSAKIFHKLGQLYCKQIPDMIKLIQTAALYNAAIARSPDNVDAIENDLKQLCNKVLESANAKTLNADLITASKQVKQEIEQMRLKVEKNLMFLKRYKNELKLMLLKHTFS